MIENGFKRSGGLFDVSLALIKLWPASGRANTQASETAGACQWKWDHQHEPISFGSRGHMTRKAWTGSLSITRHSAIVWVNLVWTRP